MASCNTESPSAWTLASSAMEGLCSMPEEGNPEERFLHSALPWEDPALGKEAPEVGAAAAEGVADREAEGLGEDLGKKAKKKKKKYHRHPKPPYTYLAMIALVIQASPDRRLKLSQIIKEISTLFPFFKEGYQGWKDSIRHNLSCNDCFHKVLKDPTKPKAKGNFWTVDVARIPAEALKLQNTPISRQERIFAVDLAPYVYNSWPLLPPHNVVPSEESTGLTTGQGEARQNSPFSIDSLLSDFQDVDLCGKPRTFAVPPPPRTLATGPEVWGPVPIFCVSSGPPVLPWRPPCHLPALRSFSSSSSLSSLDEREAEKQRPRKGPGFHTLAKRPRVLQAPESSDSDSEGGTPALPALRWEQLPTSYTTGVAPNVVAPPSHSPPFATAFPGLPFHRPTPFPSPGYWELMGRPFLSPVPSTQLSVDLDQTMPPNKSVLDVWMTHPTDIIHPALSSLGPLPSSAVVTHYESS
ncbi:forkhead box protein H1-like [Elgaria multicarinata webbii]|uniref:forkhead box protein H1-like n=1 Tax=Elgaria multicarinata webbii TaxID=159646 RepID=UPI002FCD45F0